MERGGLDLPREELVRSGRGVWQRAWGLETGGWAGSRREIYSNKSKREAGKGGLDSLPRPALYSAGRVRSAVGGA